MKKSYSINWIQPYNDHQIKNDLSYVENDNIIQIFKLYIAHKKDVSQSLITVEYYFKTMNKIAVRYNEIEFINFPYGSHTTNSVFVIDDDIEFDEFMLDPEMFIEKEKYNM